MTELDERVCDVLSHMRMLPRDVGIEVIERLGHIQDAIAADMIEEGTILLQFTDLDGDDVVLSMTMNARTAFLDVSTSEEGMAISQGYNFRMGKQGVSLAVDHDHRMKQVDHGALALANRRTTQALHALDDAKALMRTHRVFANI